MQIIVKQCAFVAFCHDIFLYAKISASRAATYRNLRRCGYINQAAGRAWSSKKWREALFFFAPRLRHFSGTYFRYAPSKFLILNKIT